MKTGLALAGGGVSGFAAIGVIQALEEAGIEITHIAGASSGAVVAALYAYGYTPAELRNLLLRLTWRYLDFDFFSLFSRLFLRKSTWNGWIKGKRLHGWVEELTDGASVSHFRIPCGIIATDLKIGEAVICTPYALPQLTCLQDIPIATAVQASFSIPFIFHPVPYRSYLLVDGGISCNCPVQIVKKLGAPHVISVDTVTPFVEGREKRFQSGLSILFHVINLNLYQQMKREHKHADIVLHPDVGQVGALSFRQAVQCVEIGYQYTKKRLPEIVSMLQMEKKSMEREAVCTP
jgi:NTE family protein